MASAMRTWAARGIARPRTSSLSKVAFSSAAYGSSEPVQVSSAVSDTTSPGAGGGVPRDKGHRAAVSDNILVSLKLKRTTAGPTVHRSTRSSASRCGAADVDARPSRPPQRLEAEVDVGDDGTDARRESLGECGAGRVALTQALALRAHHLKRRGLGLK